MWTQAEGAYHADLAPYEATAQRLVTPPRHLEQWLWVVRWRGVEVDCGTAETLADCTTAVMAVAARPLTCGSCGIEVQAADRWSVAAPVASSDGVACATCDEGR